MECTDTGWPFAAVVIASLATFCFYVWLMARNDR